MNLLYILIGRLYAYILYIYMYIGCHAPQQNLVASGNVEEGRFGTKEFACNTDSDCYGRYTYVSMYIYMYKIALLFLHVQKGGFCTMQFACNTDFDYYGILMYMFVFVYLRMFIYVYISKYAPEITELFVISRCGELQYKIEDMCV